MKSITATKPTVVQGYPFRTDGGENAEALGAQCIVGEDGSTVFGEIVAEPHFVEQVIAALNSPVKDFPIGELRRVLRFAESYLEDITSGLEDGTYKASENLDHEDNLRTASVLHALIGESELKVLPVEVDATVPDPKQVTFYFDAHACDDHGDGPQAAKLIVTQSFVDMLVELQKLVTSKSQPLSEVRVFAAPEMWLPDGIDDELRLNCAELVVSGEQFWFTDAPKHANYTIESDGYAIENFVNAFKGAENGESVFVGGCEFLLELKAELTGSIESSEGKSN